MKICSLLPCNTEIVQFLEIEDKLVGVSENCQLTTPAKVCRPLQKNDLKTEEQIIHFLHQPFRSYELNNALIQELNPDIVLTQQLCETCSPSLEHLQDILISFKNASVTQTKTPFSMEDIFQNIFEVAAATDTLSLATRKVRELKNRIDFIERHTKTLESKNTVYIEWLNPIYGSGLWTAEIVKLAGGIDPFAQINQHSQKLDWAKIIEFNPQKIIVSCRDFKTSNIQEIQKSISQFEKIKDLDCWQNKQIYFVNAQDYFARPSPRILQSVEILAEILHPKFFRGMACSNSYIQGPF